MQEVFSITSKKEGYTSKVYDVGDGSYQFFGDLDVDVDGSPNWQRDPWGQADTSLHYNGKPINSDVVRGIVLPPECIKFVSPIVLGCKSQVTYRGKTVDAVVFDIGPHFKLGEGSAALATSLGINPSPISGGVDEPEVLYRWWPGVPATVDGITYNLQPYGS